MEKEKKQVIAKHLGALKTGFYCNFETPCKRACQIQFNKENKEGS